MIFEIVSLLVVGYAALLSASARPGAVRAELPAARQTSAGETPIECEVKWGDKQRVAVTGGGLLYVEGPSVAQTSDGRVFLAGSPSVVWEVAAGDSSTVRGAQAYAGIILEGNRVLPLPLPPGHDRPVVPRIAAAGEAIDMVWGERSGRRPADDVTQVWTGRFENGRWSDVRRLALGRRFYWIYPLISEVHSRDGRSFAAVSAVDSQARGGVLFLSRDGEGWQPKWIPLSGLPSYATVVATKSGRLVLGYMAGDTTRRAGDGGQIFAITSSDTGATWSNPGLLVSAGSGQARNPVLAESASGQIALFWSQGGDSPVEERGIRGALVDVSGQVHPRGAPLKGFADPIGLQVLPNEDGSFQLLSYEQTGLRRLISTRWSSSGWGVVAFPASGVVSRPVVFRDPTGRWRAYWGEDLPGRRDRLETTASAPLRATCLSRSP